MLELEAERWAEQNFGGCQLGDVRRTRRAVQYAAFVAARPDGSTTDQVEKWKDLKAIYGMLPNDDVTFAGLTRPHFELTAILSVAAVRLLQMKTLTKREPDRPAEEVVPTAWLAALIHLRGQPIITIREFVRELAGHSGFLGRKGDGEPGWITLWRGFDKLSLILRGLEIPAEELGNAKPGRQDL